MRTNIKMENPALGDQQRTTLMQTQDAPYRKPCKQVEIMPASASCMPCKDLSFLLRFQSAVNHIDRQIRGHTRPLNLCRPGWSYEVWRRSVGGGTGIVKRRVFDISFPGSRRRGLASATRKLIVLTSSWPVGNRIHGT